MPLPEILGNLTIDEFGKLPFKDLPKVVRSFWDEPQDIQTSTISRDSLPTLQPGDHVAAQIRNSGANGKKKNQWLNHMIVVSCEGDELHVITPCRLEPVAATGEIKGKFESDVVLLGLTDPLANDLCIERHEKKLVIQDVCIPYSLISEMIRYDHASCPYEAEEVIERARSSERSWDFISFTSENLAMWAKTGEVSSPQKQVANQSKALKDVATGLVTKGLRKTSEKSAAKITTTIAKQAVASSTDDIAKGSAVTLSKTVATKVGAVAACFGVAVDIGQLVICIFRAWRRFKEGKMTRRMFIRFIITKVVEFVSSASGSIISAIVCTILGTMLGGPAGFFAGLGVGIGIGIVSLLFGKMLSFGSGKIFDWLFDWFLDRLCAPKEPKAILLN